MDENLRIKKVAVLTVEVEPSLIMSPLSWMRIEVTGEEFETIKKCEALEIKVVRRDG
jgi:hypothetical protein